jgi:hypothetical protein
VKGIGKDRPCSVVWGSSDSAAEEDSLTLDEHLFTRRKHGTIGNHQILGDLGTRDNHKELVPKPHRVQLTEFLGPSIQSELWVVGQERKRALGEAVSQ